MELEVGELFMVNKGLFGERERVNISRKILLRDAKVIYQWYLTIGML